MNKWEERLGKIVKAIFVLLTCGIFIFFIWGEVFYPRETDERDLRCVEYNSRWYQVMADGSRVPIEVPGECEPDENNTIVVENILPAVVDEDDWLCFKTSKQDVEVYVGDELRKAYSTEGTRPFGDFSVSQYIFVGIENADAGKTVTYKAWGEDVSRVGIMRNIHYGDKFGIWLHLIMNDGVETLITMFMFLIGFASVVVLGIINIRYRKNIELEYLCWGIALIAMWLITQSNIRQIFFPNVSVASSMTYFTIMIAPIPFLIYMNNVQNNRYRKMYLITSILQIANFAFCTTMQIAGICDLMDMSVLIFSGIGLAFIVIAVSFIIDWKKGCIGEYKLVAYGFLGAIVAACMQMFRFYDTSKVASGTWLSLGMLFLLLMATIKSIMDVLKLEHQKQEAIMASESKARFLANISHEIRTPINAVLGMDEMILRESKENNIKEYAMDIRSAGKNLLSLINDILDVSKIESGKMEIVPTDYKLYSFIDGCYNMMATNAQKKNLQFVVINDKDAPYKLRGDEVRLRQIAVNLLSNAIKYTKQGKVVFKIGYRKLDEHKVMLNLVVEDTGIGITKENQEKLFDTFTRVDLSKNRNIEGTGLGLSIVKQLVELMDGKITVHSEYGKGSMFSVFIPQEVVSDKTVGEYKPEIVNNAAKYKYEGKFVAPDVNVLVVDDVPMNIKVFMGLLKSTQMQIDTAESGFQCLDRVVQKKYDIIFLDHMMPGLDGIETLEKMYELEGNLNVDTPVIMLTANAISGAKEEYLRRGFTDYLSKPIRQADLEKLLIEQLSTDKMLVNNDSDNSMSTEPVSRLDKLKFLDIKTGLRYCCDDEQFYINMIKEYVTGDKTKALEQYFEAEDWDNYRIQVHGLKGTSLTIGARDMNEIALDVETAVKESRYSYVRDNHAEMMAKYAELLDKIKNANVW